MLTSSPTSAPTRRPAVIADEGRPALPSELFPDRWLPRVLRPRDLTVLCLFAVLLITNVQTVGSGGGSAFLYWLLGFLFFLIPSALVCAQLYRLFPGEGAVYLWANKALGNFWDTFLGFFCNWWPGAIGLIVEVEAVVSSLQALNSSWLMAPWQQGLAALFILCAAQALCYMSQRSLQRLLNIACLAYLSLFLVVGLAAVLWLLTGHALQSDFSAPSWQPGPANYPLFAIVTLALLGVAIPLNLGAEVSDERRVDRYLLWATLIIIAGYLLATFSVMAVLSPTDLKNSAFLDLLLVRAFGRSAGNVISALYAIMMAGYFICATAAYNSMFARLLLVAGLDRRLPSALCRLNRHKVPFNAMLVQTAINMLFIIILFFIAPGSSSPELPLTIFLVVMNGASTIWNIAMISLFLCGIILCVRYRDRLAGRFIVPPVVFHLAAVCGIAVASFAIYATFFFGSPLPDVLNNADWIFWVLLFVLASLTIGAIYSFLVPEAEDLVALVHTRRSAERRPVPPVTDPAVMSRKLAPAPASTPGRQTGGFQAAVEAPPTGMPPYSQPEQRPSWPSVDGPYRAPWNGTGR
jgi:amino acid transporter